jgi:vacuolar-type H+-ATPase subunit I/STV1
MEFVHKLVAEKEKVFATEKEQLNNDITTYKEKVSELEKEIEKFSTLEEENKTLKEEKAKLLEFKTNVEEQERKSKIEFAINSVADDLTQEQIDEWREKAKEFSNPDDFSNAIKAFAYSVSKSKKQDGVGSIRVPINVNIVDDNTNKSLWNRL